MPQGRIATMDKREYFDLDGQLGDAGDADDANSADDTSVKDHQLGFYHGELKRLIARAIVYMRLFLLNMNPYPLEGRAYEMGGEVIRSFLPGRLWDKL